MLSQPSKRSAVVLLNKSEQLKLAIWRGFASANVPNVPLWIDGKEVQSKTTEWIDLYNPANNEVRLLFIG